MVIFYLSHLFGVRSFGSCHSCCCCCFFVLFLLLYFRTCFSCWRAHPKIACQRNKSLRCRLNGHLSLGTCTQLHTHGPSSANAMRLSKWQRNWKRMQYNEYSHGSETQNPCTLWKVHGAPDEADGINGKNKKPKSGNTIASFRPHRRCRRGHPISAICVESYFCIALDAWCWCCSLALFTTN